MTPFHKVYINPALGYWKDESKQESLLPFSFNKPPITFEKATIHQEHYKYDPTHDDFMDALALVKYSFDSSIPNHLCLGKRCLICEANTIK